jgi:hypothetical protein
MFEDPKKVKKYLKISLFGDGGTGKTRFALSFPSPCVIDTEDGTAPYKKKYDFQVKHMTRWNELKAVIDWVRANPKECGTLVIDSMTVFYQSLINEVTDEVRNTRKNEVLSFGEWGKIKRRWSALLIALTGLPCHVILCMREREEYEETVNYKGEEVRKKTGNHYMDADKTTKYLFDISIRCSVERNKKDKTAKYVATVDKSRYDWIPIFTAYDITGKRAFRELFLPHLKDLSDGEEPVSKEGEPFVIEHAQEKPTVESVAVAAEKVASDAAAVAAENLPPAKSTVERNGETLEKFAGAGDQNQPQATLEDIKVLMSTCNKLTWPDGSKFSSSDGKLMIKGLYKLGSAKELRKYQVDFLYREFAEVLAGRAELALDEAGMPFVRRHSGVKQPEVVGK